MPTLRSHAKASRRAARLADGFIFTGASESSGDFAAAATLERWDRLRAAVTAAGRDVDAIGGELIIRRHADPRGAAVVARWWAEHGGTHASVATLGLGLDSTDAHLDYLGNVAAWAVEFLGEVST